MSTTDHTELRSHLSGNLVEARKAAVSYLFDDSLSDMEQWRHEVSPFELARDQWGRCVVEARILRREQRYALADDYTHLAEAIDMQATRLEEQAAEHLDHALSIGAFDGWTMSDSRFLHPLTPIRPWRRPMAEIRLAPRSMRQAPAPTL